MSLWLTSLYEVAGTGLTWSMHFFFFFWSISYTFTFFPSYSCSLVGVFISGAPQPELVLFTFFRWLLFRLSSGDGERVAAWSLWDFDYFIFVLSGSNLFLFSFTLQPNSPQYLLPLVWIPLGFVLIESVSLIFSFLSVSASVHTWSHSFLCFPEWAIIHPFAFCHCKILLNSGVTLSHYVWPYSILSFICILAAPRGVWNLT